MSLSGEGRTRDRKSRSMSMDYDKIPGLALVRSLSKRNTVVQNEKKSGRSNSVDGPPPVPLDPNTGLPLSGAGQIYDPVTGKKQRLYDLLPNHKCPNKKNCPFHPPEEQEEEDEEAELSLPVNRRFSYADDRAQMEQLLAEKLARIKQDTSREQSVTSESVTSDYESITYIPEERPEPLYPTQELTLPMYEPEVALLPTLPTQELIMPVYKPEIAILPDLPTQEIILPTFQPMEAILPELPTKEIILDTPLVVPKFTRELQNFTMLEGTLVSIGCHVIGEPIPLVTWLKDGEAVPLDDRHVTTLVEGEATLQVSELVTEDGGSYTCVATNSHGEAMSSSVLTVEEVRHRRKKEEEASVYMKRASHDYDFSAVDHSVGAEFVLPLVNLSRAVGDDVTLTVTVTCRPEPKVTWYHGEEEVKQSDRVTFQHDKGVYRLSIKDLKIEDAGKWKCHAYNDYGDDWCSCDLKIIQNIPVGCVAPMFLKELEYTTASEGSLVRLECKVKGEPKPKLKWYKDRIRIDTDGHYKVRCLESTGSSTLVIEGVKTYDSGSYMCLAENDAGSQYSEAKMNVSKPYESRSSMEPWSGPSSRSQSRAGSEYRRTRAEVAPDFTAMLKSKRAPEGTTVRLNCSVTGIPEPLVSWYKDGEEIFDNKHYTMRNNYGLLSLEIVYAKTSMSGKYTVEASNPAGTSECSCYLEIEGEEEEGSELDTFRPKFSAQIEDVTVMEGENATFMCTATGKPMPIFKWQKDMMPLSGSRKVEMEYDNAGHASLTLYKVSKADAGLYYCIAYSRSGRNKCSARLNVKAKSDSPRMTPTRDYSRASSVASERQSLGTPAMFALNLPTELDVVEGESLKLDCSVLGLPTPLVTWHKGDRELCYSQRHRIVLCGSLHTMEIPSCMMLDRGTYIVRATNAHGSVESHCYVHVLPRGSKVTYKPDYRREAMREAAKASVSSTPFFIKHLPKTIDVMTGTDVRLDCILRKGIELIRWSHSPSPPKEVVKAAKQLADEGFEGGFIPTQQPPPQEEKSAPQEQAKSSPEYLSFSETPQDLVRPVGSEAVFECSTSGPLDLEVKWYKDGRQLIPSDAVTMMSSGNRYRLKLKSLLESDQGEYTCKATAKKGTKSCAATLTIAEDSPANRPSSAPQPVEKEDKKQSKEDSKKTAPKEEKASFSQPLAKTTDAVSGNDVAFTCKVRGQVKEVTWELDNKQLPKEARYFVSYDKDSELHCLTVSKVTEKDSAKYTCVAKLADGDLIHSSTKLQVSSAPAAAAAVQEEDKEFKPRFTSGLKDTSVQDGEGLTLICEVEGNPRPQISWFRDGVEVFDSQDVQISMIGSKCTLQITDAFPEDEGDYSCTAVNVKGEVTTECYVSVEAPA